MQMFIGSVKNVNLILKSYIIFHIPFYSIAESEVDEKRRKEISKRKGNTPAHTRMQTQKDYADVGFATAGAAAAAGAAAGAGAGTEADVEVAACGGLRAVATVAVAVAASSPLLLTTFLCAFFFFFFELAPPPAWLLPPLPPLPPLLLLWFPPSPMCRPVFPCLPFDL